MSLFCDRTGFPVIDLPSLGLAIHLLPLAKTQFERYLAETAAWGDNGYEEVLAMAPRASWRDFKADDREKLFLTAIRPEEAAAFGAWLGEGWRLPAVSEWRQACQLLSDTPLTQPFLDELAKAGLDPAAAGILRGMLPYTQPKNLMEFCLFKRGVIEWVTDQGTYGGLGETRWEFAPILCQPLHGEPLRPLDRQQRIHYFGARLVCASPSGPAARPHAAQELVWS